MTADETEIIAVIREYGIQMAGRNLEALLRRGGASIDGNAYEPVVQTIDPFFLFRFLRDHGFDIVRKSEEQS